MPRRRCTYRDNSSEVAWRPAFNWGPRKNFAIFLYNLTLVVDQDKSVVRVLGWMFLVLFLQTVKKRQWYRKSGVRLVPMDHTQIIRDILVSNHRPFWTTLSSKHSPLHLHPSAKRRPRYQLLGKLLQTCQSRGQLIVRQEKKLQR